MTQPVKQNIMESDYYKNNPYLKHEESEYILIVDGNSLLKGSMIDCPYSPNNVKIGWVMNFLWKIKILLHKRSFSKIFCMWDGENSGLLKYDLYPDYKKNRRKNYSEYDRNINAYVTSVLNQNKTQKEIETEKLNDDFYRCKMLLHELLEDLFIRQIQDNKSGTESDDIIAYTVLNKKSNQKVYIITGDSDIHQLIAKDVAIYDFRKKKVFHEGNFKNEFGFPIENIVIKKLLLGDISDGIKGVKGIGEVTMNKYYPEFHSDIITVEKLYDKTKLLLKEVKNKRLVDAFSSIIEEYENGDIEKRVRIINLKNPILSKEIEEEMCELLHSPLYPYDRDFDNVYRIICREHMVDLQGNNFSSFFSPFKKVVDREINFYKYYSDTEV